VKAAGGGLPFAFSFGRVAAEGEDIMGLAAMVLAEDLIDFLTVEPTQVR
jgi:hypothetical protein